MKTINKTHQMIAGYLKYLLIIIMVTWILGAQNKVQYWAKEGFQYLYKQKEYDGKQQYDYVYQKPESDKETSGKDKKFILNICGFKKRDALKISKYFLGNAFNYEYHENLENDRCGQKQLGRGAKCQKNKYDIVLLTQCDHIKNASPEHTILMLETIKRANTLLNKNGLLVVKADKPISVLAEDDTFIFYQEKNMEFMNRYNYTVYDIEKPYFAFRKSFEFMNDDSVGLNDQMLNEDEVSSL